MTLRLALLNFSKFSLFLLAIPIILFFLINKSINAKPIPEFDPVTINRLLIFFLKILLSPFYKIYIASQAIDILSFVSVYLSTK